MEVSIIWTLPCRLTAVEYTLRDGWSVLQSVNTPAQICHTVGRHHGMWTFTRAADPGKARGVAGQRNARSMGRPLVGVRKGLADAGDVEGQNSSI